MPTLIDRADDLRARASDALSEARALVETAEDEDRDLTEEEEQERQELLQTQERLDARADRLEDQYEREAGYAERRDNPPPTDPGDGENGEQGARGAAAGRGDDPSNFRSFGEFVHSVRFTPHDPRLQDLYGERESGERYETREMSMGTGAEGGFAVPEQFRPELLEVSQQQAVIRPRATVIPAGSPPDSAITMPTLDQSSAENMYGGVEVSWIGEGDTKPETDARIREFRLEPKEVAGHTVLSDKLLRNWQAAGPTIERLFRGAIRASEDDAFLSGDGVARPQGIIGAGAEIAVNRDGADAVVYEDFTAMLNVVIADGALVWIINPGVRSELLEMEDNNGQLVWQPNAREGIDGPLFGLPILWNQRSPALGDKGDVVLTDLSRYMIKDGSGPFVAASEHVHFTDNKTVIKTFWNVDGSPWLSEPITDEGGREVSPFIVLDVP